jgi:hypothetical protein
LTGAIYLAGRKNVLGLGKVIAWTAALFGAGYYFFPYIFFDGCHAYPFIFRVRHDGANGFQQYHPADHRRGRQARAGDEFLYHGFYGPVAFWQFIFRVLAARIGADNTLLWGGFFVYHSSRYICIAVTETQEAL